MVLTDRMVGWIALKEKKDLSLPMSMYRGKGHVRTQREDNCLQPKERVLTGHQICLYIILDFQPPEL